ncbi:GAF sensor hybrid histidine kinase [Desulfofarcimen acetoxidans DSM 771]|uniref:Circadian input-output histidine kinase CikA n=1 Tax=Desulfofarcimen acetoxidans (strain ATCC 49208 / DSM 771 / KCTC 5769 / VKM B-1644 / 5575) TaxID=485916 RepID=C8W3H6_DESAS|nr:response regulator [Desulfofarcimen acetoxidans]ACV63762.1 GAF sensor hybrid histidine kinase [Desulfofarcimen acetoxidans DSM 771]
MGFKTKLYICFGSLLLLIMMTMGIALGFINQLKNNIHEAMVVRYEKVRLAGVISDETYNISRYLRDLILLDNDKNSIQKTIEKIEKSRESTLLALDTMDRIVDRPQLIELVSRIKLMYDSFIEFQKEIEAAVMAGRKDEATNLLLVGGQKYREQLYGMINEIKGIQGQTMRDLVEQGEYNYRQAVRIYLIFIILGLLIGTGITIIAIRNITGNINKVTTAINKITSLGPKEELPRVEIFTKDAIGEIAAAFNEMSRTLEDQVNRQKMYTKTLEEQSWLKSKIAEISTMYSGVKDLQTFANLLINKLTPVVGGSYGAFYMLERQEGQYCISKIAAYAFDKQDIACPNFQLGEGLVGQCALESRMITLTQIPDNYIRIASGLGSAPPKNIIIHPVKFEGQVLAVLELAALEEFSLIQQELLEQVLDDIGITIDRITSHMQVSKLLKESQVLTEELQTQAEELQLQQEELKTFNEKLDEQYKTSHQRTVELEKVRAALEEKAGQLEQTSRYKSEFLSNISHELRTPLNSLLILAQMLAENDKSNLTPKQVEYAETILSSGQDLLVLINDILDLSKVESGKMDVCPRAVKLKDIQKFLERQYLPVANQKTIVFTILIDSDLPETIFADEQRLLQILKNLLSNAFKFTEQGCVLLSIRKVQKKLTDKQEFPTMLSFAVSDTGIGISQEKHIMIFEEFRQADGTTSRKYGGSGLGLSISNKIAMLLGGFIELESEEGKGSTFTLYLPYILDGALAEAAATSEVAAEPGKPINYESFESVADEQNTGEDNVGEVIAMEHVKNLLVDRKILLVDDDMRNVFALTVALEKYGAKVLFAENGKDGINVLNKNPGIDLVLMDIMMPEMDGYEAIQTIRRMPEYKTLPVIALTAKAMKNDREKCISVGASDYICKPVNVEQLLSLIQVWLYK